MSAEQSRGQDREGKKRETVEEKKTTKDLPKTTTIRRLEQEQAETVVPDTLPQVFVRKIITHRANVRALSYRQKKQRSVERATILDWETTPTMATLAKAQAADEYLSGILKILNNEEKKSPDGKNTLKVPRMQRWYYKDINGIIRVLRNESDLRNAEDDTVFPVAVPKAQQHRLTYYYHNSLWAMHMGWRKGAALLQKAFFWVGMRRDLKDHVNRCLQCKQAKTTRPRRQGLTKLFFRTGPFECVHVDFVGPLSKIDGKWQYVFTAIDAFSRWVHLIPVRDETAEAAAEALIQRVITVHGCPLMIVSDKGAPFISNLWTELGKMLNINMTRANARHPQTNGAAERIHRTLTQRYEHLYHPNNPGKI